jgi:DNA-binding NarL/FixJ family response regulator
MRINRTTTIKVGIADDQEIFTNGLATVFEKIPGLEMVVQAKNGRDLLDKLKDMQVLPDIVIMDVDMPVMNGIEATKQVTTLYPSIKVLGLSLHTDTYVKLKMILAGCCSYFSKLVETEKLVFALEQIHKNGKYYDDIYVLEGEALWAILTEEQLSENEMRYIELTAQGLTVRQIANTLHLSPFTIANHRTGAFKKLRVSSALGMVLAALRRGLIKIKQL